jgi:hypothetical protein
MSNKKSGKKQTHGGFREHSGRKPRPGGTARICVSVQRQNWDAALERWKPRKPSWLVDVLVLRYNQTNGSILQTEAVI